jgi:uncharacterized BrkB/YihY/UPF0761 family membrane protein
MNTSDVSETPIVRWLGPRGARWYGRVLFTVLYATLIFFAARAWIYKQDPGVTENWRRVVLGSIVAALVVIAASVLTQMRIGFFVELDQLDAKLKDPCCSAPV